MCHSCHIRHTWNLEIVAELYLFLNNALHSYGFGHKHIFNLGHGIDQFVNPDNLDILIKHVKEYSTKYHQN